MFRLTGCFVLVALAAWAVPNAALSEEALTGALSFEDLSPWQQPTGDWLIAGEVFLDPDDDKRLAWNAGAGAAVNGETGRTKHLVTKNKHADVEAHVEFMVPKGSNSGVYFMGRYEIQVLDSWGVEELGHYDCGGIYQRFHEEPGVPDGERGYEGRPPKVNASRPPGEWQSFDAVFRAPRFDENGNKTANAVFVKVLHNGVLVHENQEVTGPTRSALFNDEQPFGPLMLQGDHGPVAYRNIQFKTLSGAYTEILAYDFGQSRKALIAIENAITAASDG